MSYQPPPEPHAIAFKAFEFFENGHGSIGPGAISTLGSILRAEYDDIDGLAHAVTSLTTVMLFAKEEGAEAAYKALLELVKTTRPVFERWRQNNAGPAKDNVAYAAAALDALIGRARPVLAAPVMDAPPPAG